MSEAGRPTRRQLLAAFLLSAALPPGDALGAPGDQGIGGTGRPVRRRPEPGADQGIGGTGIVGIVRGFGSIVVNGVHVSYPLGVPVFYDGRPARIGDVRIGQAVSVVAVATPKGLRTRRIDILSEVSGVVERRGRDGFVVLGQTVRTADPAVLGGFGPGDRVAVHGLRRLDGTIEATLVEAVPAGTPDRVVGPVAWRGFATIGAQRIDGLKRTFAGRRIAVEGTLRGGRLGAARAIDPLGDLAARVDRVLIESYVDTSDGAVTLGTGFPVRGGRIGSFAPGAERRGVLSATIDGDGRLRPDALDADPDAGPEADGPRRRGDDPGRPPPPDRAPGPGRPDGAPDGGGGGRRPGGGGGQPPSRGSGRNPSGGPPAQASPRGHPPGGGPQGPKPGSNGAGP